MFKELLNDCNNGVQFGNKINIIFRLFLTVIFWKKTVCGHNKYENNQHWVNKKDESGELYVLLS